MSKTYDKEKQQQTVNMMLTPKIPPQKKNIILSFFSQSTSILKGKPLQKQNKENHNKCQPTPRTKQK